MSGNVRRIRALAARLSALPDEKFDIAYICSRGGRPISSLDASGCGTAACIAGWALMEAAEGGGYVSAALPILSAQMWLDIDDAVADRLFLPSGYQSRGAQQRYTRRRAAAVLLDVADQIEAARGVGPVADWDKFDRDGVPVVLEEAAK